MRKLFTIKNVALMAVFASLAAVLMLIEVPLTFIAPFFYGLDFSEVPIMIGSFIMGPVAGAIMEAVKILLKLIMKPSTTAYVGELANFCVSCCYVLPASIIYRKLKSKKNAIKGLVVGTISMAVVGTALNYYVMIPFFSKNMISLEKIIAMGAEINPVISNKLSFVLVCVAPFNLIKGILVGIITLLVYKRISTFIKTIGNKK